MAMSYNTLVAPKGTAGSLADWIGYGRLAAQADTILTEAQSLIYQSLRVRQMRQEFTFGIKANYCRVALPPRFLDPIGKLVDTTFGQRYRHKDESDVKDARYFQPNAGGSLGTNAFTTGGAGTGLVNVNIPNHGVTQGSDVTFVGATATLDGIGLNGTFLVTDIPDANTVTFLTYDTATAGGVVGGGAAATWAANVLIASTPTRWAIWDEYLQFDGAFALSTQFRLLFFRSPALLSASNQTNFLTDRYPLLLRKACQAAAADFMKDDNEYTKATNAMAALIQATNAESDLMYRGAELDTDTP
jgi:hypothetical protein